MSTVSLSADERWKLEKNMKKAEEFERTEELELMRQPLEGQLLKFTNAFQGWQPRWFVLHPQYGELKYFLKEEHKQQNKQRGSLVLAGAIISPSEEDSLAFSISPPSGEGFKLKAADTRQRQEWINRLRTAAEDHREKKLRKALLSHGKTPELAENVRRGTARETAIFNQIHRVLTAASDQQEAMNRGAYTLSVEEGLKDDILLLKATSQALLTDLEVCHSMLMELSRSGGYTGDINIRKASSSRSSRSGGSVSGRKGGGGGSFGSEDGGAGRGGTGGGVEEIGQDVLLSTALDQIKDEDEIGEDEDWKDPELGSVDDHKSLILTSLSRMKLGTDLTKISFPLFISQSRSFLEAVSDFFANAELFVAIPDQETPEKRMLQLLKWYLSSFYSGTKNGAVKKTYNPTLGEVFRCTWVVPANSESIPEGGNPADFPVNKVKFFAEQVSHHPPVTAFYAHCPEKDIFLSGSVLPRARFMGMSFSCTVVGEVRLVLGARPGRRAECYTINLPSAHARSILTTPWFELGGKVTVACLNTGISAGITFQTKPFYGGKLHKINAEMKNCNGLLICKAQGEWNRSLEFTFPDGRVQHLSVGGWRSRRRIRPLSKQQAKESRKLWQEVTSAIRKGDLESGGEWKMRIEEKARLTAENEEGIPSTYTSEVFQPLGGGSGGWIWKEFPGIFDE